MCATIQLEEARIKVMNFDSKIPLSETCAYAINKSMNNDGPYKGKRPDLKWHHCHNICCNPILDPPRFSQKLFYFYYYL